ncbi:MAG: FkbM family methyltransferase [Deltaproteobacteria bacterium]|nr:FkbM family methyltransferase [Deltaproteobacteria bacterium]
MSEPSDRFTRQCAPSRTPSSPIRKLTDRILYLGRDLLDLYLRNTRRASRTPYGFTLQGSLSPHHRGMRKGTFEQEQTAVIHDLLLQSDVFVDVGANIGYYSCLALSLGKCVLAVEPLGVNLEHLYRNLIRNRWTDVEVFPFGLSDRPGLATLYGASSTGASLIGSWAGSTKLIRRVIPVSTLDIVLGDRFAGRKLLIKIDVEGAEYQVLKGATKTVNLIPKPAWLIEICFKEFFPGGVNPNYAATFDLFWRHGYEARAASRDFKRITPTDVKRWAQAGYCDSGAINYLFVPG